MKSNETKYKMKWNIINELEVGIF